MKRKYRPRSSDTYIPTQRTSSSSSGGRVRKKYQKRRKVSIDYGRRSSTSSMGLTDYSSAGSVYSGSSGGRLLAATAGAQVGKYLGNEVGAFVGEKAAESLYDYVNTSKFTQMKVSSGYNGRFNKGYRVKKDIFNECAKHGYLVQFEQYGSVSDPNAVMITQSTYNNNTLASAYFQAVSRKLFRLAGFNISDRDASLNSFSPFDSDGFKLVYQGLVVATGAVSTLEYQTGQTTTFSTIWSLAPFALEIANYLIDFHDRRPYKMFLYQSDRNGVDTNWRLVSQLDLENEISTFYFSSKLILQNQTKAAGATNNELDRNDAQPLTTAIYSFRGEPKIRAIGNVPVPAGTTQTELQKFVGIDQRSVRLLRAQDFVNTAFHNPPHNSMYANLKSRTNSMLQPGEMKQNILFHKISGRGVNIFEKLRVQSYGNTPVKFIGVPCKSTLFHFSEKMRTASVNPVVVHYEHELKIGCMLKTKTALAAMQTQFETVETSI